MTGAGAPEGIADGIGRRIAVVATRWYADVTDALVDGAVAAAVECGVSRDDVEVHRVPGAFELPLVAAALASSGRVAAVVCLGVVVRGGTPHFDYVCRAVTDGCTRVALGSGIPVGFGVLTVDDLDQARARAGGDEGHKGREAVLAVLETATVLDRIRGAATGATHIEAVRSATPPRH
ncbi:MAG TPA: 6,7-dimethyl-8-ribityllumazine synthase [Mycobacteriales bacterium]|nr:6,7-dimethyl-8-ribityllumazine synthase [Mycobacteriales bacterium]